MFLDIKIICDIYLIKAFRIIFPVFFITTLSEKKYVFTGIGEGFVS